MFEMKIRTGGAAFRDPSGDPDGDFWSEAFELKRILENVAANLEMGATSGVINDINGNRVGEWRRK